MRLNYYFIYNVYFIIKKIQEQLIGGFLLRFLFKKLYRSMEVLQILEKNKLEFHKEQKKKILDITNIFF